MEEAQFIFTSDPIEIKSEGEDFFVEGYISTSDIDLVNDIVTKGCILDMAEQMKKRSIKFDVEHESFRGKSNLEREANKTIIPVAKVDDFLIDKKGIKVRAMLNKNSQRFDEVKGSIQDGFLDAFSIAYVPMKSTQVTKNGQQIRMLDKINLLNVAFTGNPVNTEAKMTNVFAKSLEFMKEQEEKARSIEERRTSARNEAIHEGDKEETEDEKKKKEEEKGGPGSGPRPGQSKRQQELSDRVVDEWNRSKRTDSDVDKYNERMAKVRRGQDPFEEKDHNHISDNHASDSPNKSQEAKHKMSEENEVKENPENNEPEQPAAPEKETEEKDKELAEVKSRLDTTQKELAETKSNLEATNKEIAEIKSALKKPVMKSKVEQPDKSDNFVEKKSQTPLDFIA
jgi:HK97 family phage prohead protease